MWDLSSPTRDRTHVPCIGRQILDHWTTREVPILFVLLREDFQVHPFLAVASTLHAYCCYHLPALLQKTPHQPSLHLVLVFWFIICIIHQ